ncbi:MAG: hypothetical protein ACREOF_03495 [Gemmatimonadales bacterium]
MSDVMMQHLGPRADRARHLARLDELAAAGLAQSSREWRAARAEAAAG